MEWMDWGLFFKLWGIYCAAIYIPVSVYLGVCWIKNKRKKEEEGMATKEEDWLVSDKYCKGCKYYGTLNFSMKTRCCDYTYYTGRIRENLPKHCEVKVKGKRPMGDRSTDLLSEKGRRERRNRGRCKVD